MDTTVKSEIKDINLAKMRILYLPLLINKEETIKIVIKDCSLVVDAFNFFFDDYETNGILSTFGIEANAYAEYIKEKIKIFEKANVKCYYVFDNWKTNIETKSKCEHNIDFEANKNTSFLFMKDVCFQVLEESGLNYATCVVEGKEDCAALARKLECSVLSNNIQFCFKNVPYVPIRTLHYKAPNNYITVSQFKLNNFLDKHSLTKSKTALFVALSDVEVFPPNYFDIMLQQWGVWNKNIYVQHKNLFKWLPKQDEDKIKKDITEFFSSKSDIKKFFNHFQRILDNMQNDNTSSLVADYLYNDLKLSVSIKDPLWFEKGVATQKISINYINIYKYKFIRGSRVIQNTVLTDNIMISIDIIKYAYNLLTNYESNGSFCIYQLTGNPVIINTEESNVKKPQYGCFKTVFENGWTDIKRLKLFEHFLYEHNINIDKLDAVPDSARILLLALVYFARKKLPAGVNVSKEVYCFIISYVLLDHPQLVGQEVKKYFKCNQVKAREIFDADILNPLEEMQYCLLHMNYLNALCGTPYTPTTYHTTYNGTFIYKLLRDMDDSNPKDFIDNLFQSSPTTLLNIKTLISAYQELCYEQ